MSKVHVYRERNEHKDKHKVCREMPASAPLPISASEAKGRFSFLRPPILFTAVHLSHARNVLSALSIVAAKIFGSYSMPTACMYCTSTRFMEHRVTPLTPSRALRLEKKRLQRV